MPAPVPIVVTTPPAVNDFSLLPSLMSIE